MFEIFILTGL